ncbi:MAG: arsenosugar biosynthesis radical SAM protein ArsS [Gordonibacter sp.]|uniref:arsenosugar biosynthesis radical SAM (seleno)protein ArsS n=1 Tax=Gordonibacter sp. TaxID=1968902 RepID=UPI002FCAA24A
MAVTDEAAQATMDAFPPFFERTDEATCRTLERLEVLQVNVGSLCNLACRHCHMEAGPHRTEVMSRETLQSCLDVCTGGGFKTLDITGGAPEMNPHFEWFVREAAARGIDTIVRSNLVVMLEKPYAHLPEVLAEQGVTLVASLPHYTAKPVEKQRGAEVFDGTIRMLQKLNALGYGKGEGLVLNLVFNPSGAFLPPEQEALEKEYRQKLADDFGISFDSLFVIANNPLGRFGNLLHKTGNLERYMSKLVEAFNAETVAHMMCRSQLSVGWDGAVYDCDFNQAAGLPCKDGLTIADYANDPDRELQRDIVFGNHCYACCAGAGSS